MTLTDFLLARIAEDEYDANQATRWPWDAYADGQVLGVGQNRVAENVPSWNGPHIARHDPARALAECEAKRAAIEAAWGDHLQIEGEWGHGKGMDQLEAENDQPDVVRILAAVYSDHPEYRDEWRP